MAVTTVRYDGITHDFMMLNPLSGTHATRAAVAQAISVLREALHRTWTREGGRYHAAPRRARRGHLPTNHVDKLVLHASAWCRAHNGLADMSMDAFAERVRRLCGRSGSRCAGTSELQAA